MDAKNEYREHLIVIAQRGLRESIAAHLNGAEDSVVVVRDWIWFAQFEARMPQEEVDAIFKTEFDSQKNEKKKQAVDDIREMVMQEYQFSSVRGNVKAYRRYNERMPILLHAFDSNST
jgi:hypothetical protein